MNRTETAAVLTKIASYDRRTLGEADVLAWQEILEDVSYADALEAVRRHYREQRGWIMPADIHAYADARAAERHERFGGVEALVQADPSDAAAYRAELAGLRRQVAMGELTPANRAALERGRQ